MIIKGLLPVIPQRILLSFLPRRFFKVYLWILFFAWRVITVLQHSSVSSTDSSMYLSRNFFEDSTRNPSHHFFSSIHMGIPIKISVRILCLPRGLSGGIPGDIWNLWIKSLEEFLDESLEKSLEEFLKES